jgi:hypothetical protein
VADVYHTHLIGLAVLSVKGMPRITKYARSILSAIETTTRLGRD